MYCLYYIKNDIDIPKIIFYHYRTAKSHFLPPDATPPATQCLPSVAVAVAVTVAVAGMAGCLIPFTSAASNVIGLRPQVIVTSLLRCD